MKRFNVNEWLNACREYIAEHGDLLVPQKYVSPDGVKLGYWIIAQRVNNRKGTINPEVKAELDKLGMIWDVRAAIIKNWLTAYSEYIDTYGNPRVPISYVTADGLKLGVWVDEQRKKYRRGKLKPEVKAELDKLGMVWDVGDLIEKDNLKACREYIAEHGDLLVPWKYVTSDGIKLGAWISTQRQKHKKGTIAPELKAELDKLGMVWSVIALLEKNNLKACREYLQEHGDLLVPRKYVTPDGIKLGAWIGTQRRKYKKGTIDPELKAELDKLGMVWIVKVDTTEKCLNACRKYISEHGNLLVPYKYVTHDGFALGAWIGTQRNNNKKGTIDSKLKEDLNKLGMVWWIRPSIEDWLDACREYAAEHGNLLVPSKYETSDGIKLGRWIGDQRVKNKKGILDPKVKAELNKLGMVWDLESAATEDWLSACKEYVTEHGNLHVPAQYVTADGLRLGNWIMEKRRQYKKGVLAPELIAELNKLGMVWSVNKSISIDEWLKHCREYLKEHGDLLVPGRYVTPDGLNLGDWITTQRQKHKKGTIDPELKAELDKLGMVWSVRVDTTEKYLNACRKYLREHGHLRVPAAYKTPEGINLGSWIYTQRKKYKEGTIDPELKAELDKLGMVWQVNIQK